MKPWRAATPKAVVVDRIVAVVDGDPILLSTLRARARSSLKQLPSAPEARRKAARKLYHTLVKRLVEERLVEHAARDAGVKMDRAAVDRTIERLAAQWHYTREELLQRVRDAGMTEDDYRAEIGRQLVERDLLWAFMRKSGVHLDGAGDEKQARVWEREHKRWIKGLREHASIQQYYWP